MVRSIGPNFGYRYEYKQLPIIKTIANIESAPFNNPTAQDIRYICTNFLNGYQQTDRTDKLLNQFIRKTQRFMKNDNQIVVIKSDKGNKTVIMNKSIMR